MRSPSSASVSAYIPALIAPSVGPCLAASAPARSTASAGLVLADRGVDDARGRRVGAAVAAAGRHRLVRGAFDSRAWISAAIGGVNGMWMSTSGRQKKPRSARMTRKSWATASIAPAAKQ